MKRTTLRTAWLLLSVMKRVGQVLTVLLILWPEMGWGKEAAPAASSTSAKTAATKGTAPKAAELKAFVVKHLAETPGFDDKGLITRSQAKRVIGLLTSKGWQVDNTNEVLDRTLPDDDFLVRQLSDPAGKKFLEQISKVGGSLDRVDRIARMPHGETNINDLIRKVPNGHEWITSMSNTPHGRRMSKLMENAQGGDGFNDPTGRIYTVDDLVKSLDGHVVAK